MLFFSLQAAIIFQSTTCRFWQWADEAVPVVQDIAMQIAALQDDSRGVAAFRSLPRPSDPPTQNEDNRLKRLDERMERVEKILQKLVKLLSFAVFLLLFLVVAK